MPYTHFRMIGYEVPTATFQENGPVVSGWDPGVSYREIARLPVPDKINDDARVRLRRLAGVVDFAETKLQTLGDNANTLKVFVVPEFYFRPPADLGATYRHNTYPDIVSKDILTTLEGMFVHADFSNWLFICGTMMWNTLNDQTAKPVYFNTALYVLGGQTQGLHIIEKQLASGIDGVPVASAPSMDPQVAQVFANWNYRKQHVFAVDNVTFGLEVCLDHLNYQYGRVLKRTLAAWPAREGVAASPEVKIHVLTAGGMGIKLESVAAKVGGYIFRNDGITNPAPHSELRQVQSYDAPADPLGAQKIASNQFDPDLDSPNVANLAASVVAAQSDPVPHGALTLPMPLAPGQPYESFPQRVVFYPALPLPN